MLHVVELLLTFEAQIDGHRLPPDGPNTAYNGLKRNKDEVSEGTDCNISSHYFLTVLL